MIFNSWLFFFHPDQVRQYLTQLRQETGKRLCDAVYAYGEGQPDKWWMMWTKRKFLNTTLA
jgi:actin related protein 2/3 complex subunit 3